MKVGFIGTGSMGSLLIEAFMTSGALLPAEVTVSNRTFAKAQTFAERYPGIKAEFYNADTAQASDIVFICVKPHEFIHVVKDIRPVMTPDKIVVSITSPVLVSHLEGELNCKIAKIIPSITNLVWSGSALCIYGDTMEDRDKKRLEALFDHISEPLRIEESYTRIVSDLSSCGPAFMAFLLEQFVNAAVEETGIPRESAQQVASNMLLGTALLLTEGRMTPAEVQERVAVPGGITAKALKLLERKSSGMFQDLIATTHAKYREDLIKVSTSFYGEEVNGQ